MSDSAKIKLIVNSLAQFALGDVKRASEGGSKMGAFILCSCLIDAIAGFIKGDDTTRGDYKSFVNDFLPTYDSDGLYHDLRCKLVHGYALGQSYIFVDSNPTSHLQQDNGRTLINLENFIFDIEKALNTLIGSLLDPNEEILRRNAIKRFDNNGIIQVFDMRHAV